MIYIFLSGLLLMVLGGISYRLSTKNGQKDVGLWVNIFFVIFIILGLLGQLLLAIFIWPVIFTLQITLITYWLFELYGKRKAGLIISIILGLGLFLTILYPWIEDWTISKKEIEKILSWQDIHLNHDLEKSQIK